MPAPSVVSELVDRFPSKGTASFQMLNETSVRREFLDPLFAALGWDVDNSKGSPVDYKEVIHEDKIRTRNRTGDQTSKRTRNQIRTPDYAFRLAGKRKFFVEAKRPTARLREDPQPARQLRRYGWSAKLPLSVVTDFQEFCVYDCSREPRADDNADVALQFVVPYQEYEQRWDELYGLFSREAVLDGALDKYLEEQGTRKGTKTVDQAFLAEMQSWRLLLAKNIATRNPGLSAFDLNYAVQMTLDRLLFLRVAEDRGIEPYEQLKLLVQQTESYARLCRLFKDADDRYNSGLFHFEKERGRESPHDDLTLHLTIDNKPLREIVERLYYPYPYEFGVIPVEIMGHVYEQFLGQVIHVDEHRKVSLVAKPEVRKAGGVFYTPSEIVAYIVERVVGGALARRTPVETAKLRILDAACGSGSFLVGAYRYLLEWHRRRYIEEGVRKHKQELYQDIYGDWQLTTSERKRILLNNIYGVDIDPYAVEVAKLSLLLVVLEGATEEGLAMQLRFAHERALPDLDKNIKCGNSLISADNPQLKLLTEEERRAINPFNWREEFPEVAQAGWFDILLGNPPYIRIQMMREWAAREVELYGPAFETASKGSYDKYALFVEKGLHLLNAEGQLGYILPNKFFNAQYGATLRNLIAQGRYLAEVVHFGDQQVFAGATTYTAIIHLNKVGQDQFNLYKVGDLKEWYRTKRAEEGTLPMQALAASEWNFTVGRGGQLLARLEEIPTRLGGMAAKVFQGLVTSSDAVYLLEPAGEARPGYVRVRSRATGKEYEMETGVVHPLCKGSRDIRRYHASPSKYVLFPYDAAASERTGKTVLIDEHSFERQFPRAWAYLLESYDTLRDRERGKMRHSGWYGYVYPKSIPLFARKKLLTPSIAQVASYTLDERGSLYFVGSGGGGGGGYGIILRDDCFFSYEYLLGLLNSRLVDYYLKQISSPFSGGYFAYNKQYIEQVPIAQVDFASKSEATRYDEIESLVERMLTLHERRSEERSAFGKTLVQRQIDDTERQIDELVFDIYALTSSERQLIDVHAQHVNTTALY